MLNQQYRLAIGPKALKRVYNLLQCQWGRDLRMARRVSARAIDSICCSPPESWKPRLAPEQGGRVFCLVEAPSAKAAADVHREAHGLVADHIYQVQEGS